MTKPASEDDLHGSDNTTRELNKNTKFKIGDEFVKILHDNACNGIDRGDVIDHISKVLEILEWVKITDVDKDQLRLYVFSISLSGRAREWWDNETKESNQYSPQIPVPAECDIRNPNELCKSKEFTVVRYSIGSDEEFITLSPSKYDTWEKNPWEHDAIRRILGFGIRRIDYLYRPCCNKIDELVMVYSEKDVC
ncbi:hypothetical protein Tco_0944107 [Tanacetum coccineum]